MLEARELLVEVEALTARAFQLRRRWRCTVPLCDGMPHEGWTHHHARHTQWEPDDYRVWALISGRGFGKTRTGSETSRTWGDEVGHYAVIAKSDREVRNICFEGRAGLLAVIPPEEIAKNGYRSAPGNTSLTLRNGTVFRAFSAEQPDVLRGYAFDGAWCDEYAAWSPATAQSAWDNLWFALREAQRPHVIVTTTPKPLPHVKRLIDRIAARDAYVLTTGTTFDNAPNLSVDALDELTTEYAGTRLGRQELGGELLLDVEGALWTALTIDPFRLDPHDAPDTYDRIVIAIDPAVTAHVHSDLTGIVVVGRLGDHFYVLEDATGRYTPAGWSNVAVKLFDKWSADAVVAEVNNGGDMVEATLRQVAPDLSYRKVYASRGKHTRAEPVAALYEQGRCHHVGLYGQLEDQLTTWTPDQPGSPDRMDALVWAVTDLAFRRPAPAKAKSFKT